MPLATCGPESMFRTLILLERNPNRSYGHMVQLSALTERISQCGGSHDSIGCGNDVRTLSNHGRLDEAIHISDIQKQISIQARGDLYVCLLQKCLKRKALAEGKQVHAQINKAMFEINVLLGTMLVNMYSECGSVLDAQKVFDNMSDRSVCTWNILIAVYTKHGCPTEAFELFQKMQREGADPDKRTLLSVLQALGSLGNLNKGKWVHACSVKIGIEQNIFIGNSLVDMYAKCGSIEDACHVFDRLHARSVVSWTVMISGYVKCGHAKEAFKVYQKMEQEGLMPNEVTFLSMLQACAGVGALKQGKQIHAHIINSEFASDVLVFNSLVTMYAKCGNLEDACLVFHKIPVRNVVSWNALISGYVESGAEEEAFKLYSRMELEGMKPNKVTFLSMLTACANLAALEQGKQLHADITNSRFGSDIEVGNALVNMYAKCGSIMAAHQTLKSMPKRNVVSWTVMIAGYAQHGCGMEALQIVEQMQCDGVNLDQITLVSVLSACSHTGLIDEGFYFFHSMEQNHCIRLMAEHYTCMVDLLGRAGRLWEAEELIREMPCQPTADVWRALLGSCRIHGNVELAKCAAKRILMLEAQDVAACVMLSNVFAAAGRGKSEAA